MVLARTGMAAMAASHHIPARMWVHLFIVLSTMLSGTTRLFVEESVTSVPCGYHNLRLVILLTFNRMHRRLLLSIARSVAGLCVAALIGAATVRERLLS